MKLHRYRHRGWVVVYDTPPASPNNEGSNGGGGEPANANPDTGRSRYANQDEINRIVAKDRRETEAKFQRQLEELNNELTSLRERSNLTQQERQEQEQRIQQLLNQNKTTEQRLQDELNTLNKKYKTEIDKITDDVNRYKGLFQDHLFRSAVSKAVIDHKGCDSEAFEAMLRPNYELVEVLDSEGKPTGNYAPKIRRIIEKDGRQETILVSIEEQVKWMSEQEKYFYLFQAGGSGGAGGSTHPGSRKGPINFKNIKEYKARRQELGLPPVGGKK